MDGFKFQFCDLIFLEVCDVIIQVDEVNYGGVNCCLIWEIFVCCGMGVNVVFGGDENFDLFNICLFVFCVIKIVVMEVNVGDVIIYELEIMNGCMNFIDEVFVLDILLVGIMLVEGSFDCDL